MEERKPRQMTETTKLTVDDLVDRVTAAFVAARTSKANARRVALALVTAEIDGQKGHGLSRVESYTAGARAGKIDGFAEPTLAHARPASLVIDAAHGFAYPAVDLMLDHLPATTREAGLAGCAITRSHHCGAIGWHVQRLAEQGLLALAFANTPNAMAPWGASRRLYGTNPIAFAAPQPGGPPVVVDLALSEVARGKILNAAQNDQPIPEGWATDAEGNPTTDAKAALAGTLLPIGGPKGAALAFMVEILSAALTGANFAFEASSFFDGEGDPPGVGQFFIAIDPDAFTGREAFLARMGLIAGLIADDPGTRLPGSRRYALREAAARDGIAVSNAMLARLDELANTPA
jgi:(2R)-3-sulfolactate dehydrogenase (NADP+)